MTILAGSAAMAADEWAKVKAIRSGVELKIYKTGAKQPLEAKMDEATDEALLVATKKEQLSIPREQIERIDARPAKEAKRPKPVTTTTTGLGAVPGTDPSSINRPTHVGGPTGSSSTTTTYGSGPDFETVYRRVSAAPKAQK